MRPSNDRNSNDITQYVANNPRRRNLFQLIGAGSLAVTALTALPVIAAASSNGAKVVFVLFRRGDLTHAQCMAEWKGALHSAKVRAVPGLQKWVQNHPTIDPAPGAPDGIGELWFADSDSMDKAMKSAEMAAAGEDAKRFLDMEKTFALFVSEQVIIG